MQRQKIWTSAMVFTVLLAVAASLVFAFVEIKEQTNLNGVISEPGNTASMRKGKTLLVESNQDVKIAFSTTGDIKREERGSDGKGLNRFDEIKKTTVKLGISGENDYEWQGNLEDLNGLTTDTITPDQDDRIWWNLKVKAKTSLLSFDKDKEWDASLDAGIYQTSITITVITVGQPPRPSLEFIPDVAEGGSSLFCVEIHNSGTEKKDSAENVRVRMRVLNGAKYVKALDYNPKIGNIESEESKGFLFTIITNTKWDSAPLDTEIKVEIEIVREDNWPEHNEGKIAYYSLVK
ncbi:MAG: hypothetical protein PHW01_02295 [Patescibacteria group bacterium]|nr:hypothetical protein [Patescibacteria group bacterium]